MRKNCYRWTEISSDCMA